MELLLTVKGSYSKYEVRSMIDDILLVLDFHLLPQSPYSEGSKWLMDSGYSSLLPSYQSLLNGICSSTSWSVLLINRLQVYWHFIYKYCSRGNSVNLVLLLPRQVHTVFALQV